MVKAPDDFKPLPPSLPSLQVVLMSVVFGQSARELFLEVPEFIRGAEGFLLPVAMNSALLAYAAVNLGNNFGLLGKVAHRAPNFVY